MASETSHEEPERFTALEIAGAAYYPIGAFAWIWDEELNAEDAETCCEITQQPAA